MREPTRSITLIVLVATATANGLLLGAAQPVIAADSDRAAWGLGPGTLSTLEVAARPGDQVTVPLFLKNIGETRPKYDFIAFSVGSTPPPAPPGPSPGRVTYTFAAFAPPAVLCFVDDDADGLFDRDEPVYLAAACGAVAGNDIRVANPGGGQALGSFVRASHTDFSNPTIALPGGPPGFFDADGDAAFSIGDTMYWDTDVSATVTVNDIVLSGAQAGQVVVATTGGLNNALLASAIANAVFDGNGDAVYNRHDVVYWDLDASGDATVGDVRWNPSSAGVFGSVVSLGDLDTTYTFGAYAAPAVLCFVDDNADGVFDGNESAYLAGACGTVAGNDIRVANPGGGQALGSFVRASHTDFDNPTIALPGGPPGFFDADGDAAFSIGDTMYWDTDVSATVTENDIVLSGTNAGMVVTATTSGLNNALLASAIANAVFDGNGDAVYNSQDVVYWDLDASGDATVADIRWNPSIGGVFGSVVSVGDFDTTYTFAAFAAPAVLCFVDDDADGLFDRDEPVYLAAACGAVAGNDIRVANPGGGQALGSFVRASHADFSNPTVALPGGPPGFFDADGDAAFSTSDTMYWDTDVSATVTVNDIVLSGTNAGMVVTATTSGLNNALLASAIANAVFDGNGDAVYNSQDIVYWDLDASGDATVADIVLSGDSFGQVVHVQGATPEPAPAPSGEPPPCVSANALTPFQDRADLIVIDVTDVWGRPAAGMDLAPGTSADLRVRVTPGVRVPFTNGSQYACALTLRADGSELGELAPSRLTVLVEVRVDAIRVNRAPVARFDVSEDQPFTGTDLLLRDLSSDPDGIIRSRFWSFGDGVTNDVQDPVHRYDDDGAYEVKLRVWDDDGEPSEATMIVTVRNRPPRAAFELDPFVVNTGQTVSFTDASTDADGTIVERAWAFGDGGQAAGQGAELRAPEHVYLVGGEISAALTVTDDDGDSDSTARPITVIPLVMSGRARAIATTLAESGRSNHATSVTGGDTGEVETEGDADATEEGLEATSGDIAARFLSSRIEARIGVARAETRVGEVVLPVRIGTFDQPLRIEGAWAMSMSTCDVASGGSGVGRILLGDAVLVGPELTPAPDTRVDLPAGSFIVLHEHVVDAERSRGLTVNAVHVVVPGLLDVVVASARSGIDDCIGLMPQDQASGGDASREAHPTSRLENVMTLAELAFQHEGPRGFPDPRMNQTVAGGRPEPSTERKGTASW